jgi:hypothetical protein
MRLTLLAILLVAASLASAPAQEEIEVLANGTISQSSGFSAPTGSPIFFNYIIDESTSLQVSDVGTPPTQSSYVDTSHDASVDASVGTFKFSRIGDSLATIYSDSNGTYGYDLSSQSATVGNSYTTTGINLLSTMSSVAPTTSLNSIQALPLSDFNDTAPQGQFDIQIVDVSPITGQSFVVESATGTITSYTVQITGATAVVPEPSTYELLGLGGLFLLLWARRGRLGFASPIPKG